MIFDCAQFSRYLELSDITDEIGPNCRDLQHPITELSPLLCAPTGTSVQRGNR